VVDQEVNPPKTEERHLVVPLATELFLYYAFCSNEKKVVDQDINPPKSEERHLVVPLATELFLYYAFHSNGKKVVDEDVNIRGFWLTGTSTLRYHYQQANIIRQPILKISSLIQEIGRGELIANISLDE